MKREKHPTWFKLKVERRELLKALPPESAVKVVLVCLDYLETMEQPENLSELEKIGFAVLLDDLKEAWSKYAQRVSARSGISSDTDRYRTILDDGRLQTEKTEDRNKKIEIDSLSVPSAFSPPTDEEVKAFCLAESLCIDPKKFVSYYAKNGWCSGGEAIRDWKALARSWSEKEKSPRRGHKADHTTTDPSENPFSDWEG